MQRDAFLRRNGLLAGLALAAIATVVPTAAHAQAYLLWHQGARASAMGSAAAGVADDPSAVFYSPAAIAHLYGTHVQIGATAAADEAHFRTFGGDAFDRELEPTLDGSFYATHTVAQRLTFGLGVNTPWGLAVEWQQPQDFVGRFQSVDSRLRSIQFNPVLAYGPFEIWSAAVGVDMLNAVFERTRFEQDPLFSALGGGGPIALARSRFDGDGTGVGWNAAVMARPSDRLAVGAQYRSDIDIDLSGRADFAIVAPPELRALPLPDGDMTIGELLDERYVAQNARSRFTFPRVASFGAALRPIDELLIAVDAQWTGWGEVDSLAFGFADTLLADSDPLRYEDAWTLRWGAEVGLQSGLLLRLGYAWEDSPATLAGVMPLLPDAGRDAYSAGLGFHWAGTAVDLAYVLTVFDDREGVAFPENEIAADGIYEGVSHRFGISLSRGL